MSDNREKNRGQRKQSSALAYIDDVNAKQEKAAKAAKAAEVAKSGIVNPNNSIYLDAEGKERWTKNGKLVKKEDANSKSTADATQKSVLPAYDPNSAGKDKGYQTKGSSYWPTGGHGSYGTGSGASSGTTVYAGNVCHHSGVTAVCEIARGITLAGAKGNSIHYGSADVVLDCAGLTKKEYSGGTASLVSGTPWLVEAVLPTIKHPDTLFLTWPDMGIPEVGPDFWLALVKAVPDNSRIVACCIGGHGRTGTAIACMIAASAKLNDKGIPDADVIIKFVRSKHCKHAVETKGQEDYIARAVAEYSKPGDKVEVNRQYALCDAAFGVKGLKATNAASSKKDDKGTVKKVDPATVVAVDKFKEAAVGQAAIPFADDAVGKQTVESHWLDVSGVDGAEVVGETVIEEQMFVDFNGDIVNEDGQILFFKTGLSEEEIEWSKTIPTWGEFIEKKMLKDASQAGLGEALKQINGSGE